MHFVPKTSKPDYGPAFTYRRHLESRLKMLTSLVALLWRFAVSGSDAAATTLWTKAFVCSTAEHSSPCLAAQCSHSPHWPCQRYNTKSDFFVSRNL